MTLTKKLVLGGILLSLVPFLTMGILSTSRTSDALKAIAENRALVTAQGLSEMVHVAIMEELNMLKEITVGNTTIDVGTTVAREGTASVQDEVQKLSRKLISAKKNVGHNYEVIFVTDNSGTIYADSEGGTCRGMSIGERPYFKSAKNGKPTIGNVILSQKTGKPVVPLCGPIFSESGEVVGTVTVVLKTDFFVEQIKKIKIGETGYAFMADEDGNITAHPKQELILKLNIKTLQGMKSIAEAMSAKQTGVQNYLYEGMDKIAGYAPVEATGWSIAVTQPVKEFMSPVYAIQNMMILSGSIFLVIITALIILFGRSISKPITNAISGLNEGSEQVAAASSQVSAASQQLAEGSSQQAASIEETSSALEEMSSMTKQNAENAVRAQQLVAISSEDIGEANHSMKTLTHSMMEISKTSEETQKIIRTIDEIAFQTNLLALNAAVEAARAGEAGAGFAVVADEVRNLAMRAAEAAKSTSGIIEDTIKRVKEGSQLLVKANDAFAKVETGAQKIGELIGEISAASTEQAQGIEQVNRAVGEMDKVIQQNAANAEESASASEELNAQAEQMREFVKGLAALVGATHDNGRRSEKSSLQKHSQKIPSLSKVKSIVPGEKNAGKQKYSNISPLRSQQIIPLDEKSFEEF
ncbi:methyl-accepting chemotaxis protein [Desulforhabdus amnigena]|uniref:Methyl-accepting transducer domain-containing protein n=1 Tax=Desulforhabdus amnigena TaxID=40218 RepID=A0A9W6FVG8_9BACT|nr:methyl-accepting chemotaxis protein [Desulforhabdus amnigena]GLI35629.1 hypothetical protein DAMNIGENAA_30620 [Desulforhabdus amnigena]